MHGVRFDDDNTLSEGSEATLVDDTPLDLTPKSIPEAQPTSFRKRSLSYRQHLQQTVKAFYVDEFNHLSGYPRRIIVTLAVIQICLSVSQATCAILNYQTLEPLQPPKWLQTGAHNWPTNRNEYIIQAVVAGVHSLLYLLMILGLLISPYNKKVLQAFMYISYLVTASTFANTIKSFWQKGDLGSVLATQALIAAKNGQRIAGRNHHMLRGTLTQIDNGMYTYVLKFNTLFSRYLWFWVPLLILAIPIAVIFYRALDERKDQVTPEQYYVKKGVRKQRNDLMSPNEA